MWLGLLASTKAHDGVPVSGAAVIVIVIVIVILGKLQ